MKILPGSPPLPHGVRSSSRIGNRISEIEVCSNSPRTVNLIRDCTAAAEKASVDHIDDLAGQSAQSRRSSSCGDGDDGDIVLENHPGSRLSNGSTDLKDSDDEEEEEGGGGEKEEEEDDDDGMQWANSRRPLETAPQSFGYGVDHKGFPAGKMAFGKENKIRISRKLASRVQQQAGPIKPNSGPFSGPLKATAKPNMAPSIIPVNLKCKKVLGFDICEPMSPEVTCLGRIKIREAHESKAANGTPASKPVPEADTAAPPTPKVEKGRCFNTKNQLCTGKKPKPRKKKKVAEKSKCLSRRRRLVSKEATDHHSQGFASFESLEHGETRREKAAFLARSLTDLLEDVRRNKKERIDYEPIVPPRNSLLLMRGCRRRDNSYSPSSPNMREEVTTINIEVCDFREEVEVLDEEGSGDANVNNLRSSACVHFSLLDLIDMGDEEFSSSEIEDPITTHRTSHGKDRASKAFQAVENGDNKKKFAMESWSGDEKSGSVSEGRASSRMRLPRVALWQRRSFTELRPIITNGAHEAEDGSPH